MFDVTSTYNTAVLCNESIECLPGTASKFFFTPFVILPMASIIADIIIYFLFHIVCTFTRKLFYFFIFLFLLSLFIIIAILQNLKERDIWTVA